MTEPLIKLKGQESKSVKGKTKVSKVYKKKLKENNSKGINLKINIIK